MFKKHLEESIKLHTKLLDDEVFAAAYEKAVNYIGTCLKNGNKLLVAGNGGSAADAQHFAAEIVGRYKKERRGYPAIALTTDTSIITAWSNDYSFETLFSRQIEALGKPGDVFLGISTSGNSKNIIEGVRQAKKGDLDTIAILGNNGGALKEDCDISLIVPSSNTPRIQEIHILTIHSICEKVEKDFI